jgi:hypothetical protein
MIHTESQFDEIRPFRDTEVPEALQRLLKAPRLAQLIQAIYPELPVAAFEAQLKQIRTVQQFQQQVMAGVVERVINTSTRGLSVSGLENLQVGRPYLFISNHRDIVLDSAFLNYTLNRHQYATAEIAIGDNLLQEEWIKDLVKLNKSFIVKRNLPKRELVLASRHLSEYISYTIKHNGSSVWIAQREGRAKDGNDRTHPGLVNMLGMCSAGNLADHFAELNILPVSFSYEKDPCDVEKVREIYAKRFAGSYAKAANEDSQSMKKGIMGDKGRVHITFGSTLNERLQALPDNAHKNEIVDHTALLIDQQILKGYRLWPHNYVAYDLMHGAQYDRQYSEQEKEQYMNEIDAKVAEMEGDPEQLRTIFYEISARPVMNQLQILGQVT